MTKKAKLSILVVLVGLGAAATAMATTSGPLATPRGAPNISALTAN